MNKKTQNHTKPALSQTDAARALRVPRETLNRALRGTRKNPRLVGLYHDLLSIQKQNSTPK